MLRIKKIFCFFFKLNSSKQLFQVKKNELFNVKLNKVRIPQTKEIKKKQSVKNKNNSNCYKLKNRPLKEIIIFINKSPQKKFGRFK